VSEASKAASAFVVLFVAAFVVSLGSLAGSFADADQVFVDRYANEAVQLRDTAGALLLLLAGMAFAWFAQAISTITHRHSAGVLISGCSAAVGMFVAALVWATVPMSLWFGSIFGDPGLEVGTAVLPQMGYVALMVGGLLPAGIFIALVGHQRLLLPRWLSIASYPAAVLVAVAAVLFMPLFIFVAWVIAVAVSLRKRSD
jgi:hypothetical protein